MGSVILPFFYIFYFFSLFRYGFLLERFLKSLFFFFPHYFLTSVWMGFVVVAGLVSLLALAEYPVSHHASPISSPRRAVHSGVLVVTSPAKAFWHAIDIGTSTSTSLVGCLNIFSHALCFSFIRLFGNRSVYSQVKAHPIDPPCVDSDPHTFCKCISWVGDRPEKPRG